MAKLIDPGSKSTQVRTARRALSLTERDFLTAFALWLGLELVCFWIAPSLGLINPPSERMQNWLLATVVAGVGGAVLVGVSSQLMKAFNQRKVGPQRSLLVILAQLSGGLGLAGVMLPVVMVTLEFIAHTFEKLMAP